MKADTILQTIGNTPHVRIHRLFGDAEVWLKCERANPGGSLKDRIALGMVEAAERSASFTPAAQSSSRPAATRAWAWRWSPPSRAIDSSS